MNLSSRRAASASGAALLLGALACSARPTPNSDSDVSPDPRDAAADAAAATCPEPEVDVVGACATIAGNVTDPPVIPATAPSVSLIADADDAVNVTGFPALAPAAGGLLQAVWGVSVEGACSFGTIEVHRSGVAVRFDPSTIGADPRAISVSADGAQTLWTRELWYTCGCEGHCDADPASSDVRATGTLLCEKTATGIVACRFSRLPQSDGSRISGWFHVPS